MTFKKAHILTLTTVLVLGAGAFGATRVSAQTPNFDAPMTSLVQKLVDKFGLKKQEVQSVFDEVHADKFAEMQSRMEERLSQLVENGKITEEQKKLILEKHEELAAKRRSEMEEMKNMLPEERKAAIEAKRTELENWAKENGIDLKYLMGSLGKFHGRHGMRGM